MNGSLRLVCFAGCLIGGFSSRSEAQSSPQPKGECTIVGYIAEDGASDDFTFDHSPLEITFKFDGKKVGKLSVPSSAQLKFPCTPGNHAVEMEIKNKRLGVTTKCVSPGVFVPAVYSPWVEEPDRSGRFRCQLHRLPNP